MTKITFPWLKLQSSSSTGITFIITVLPAVGWGCCQSPACCHWLKNCASKKVAGDICFPEKKRKEILPTSARDGDRDRPQLSPAAPIGWQFVQNPTQTTSLTTHQQIRKAYLQPPPSLRRCRTASEPDAGSALNFYPHCCSVSEDGCFCFCAFLSAGTPICAQLNYFSRRKPRRQRT